MHLGIHRQVKNRPKTLFQHKAGVNEKHAWEQGNELKISASPQCPDEVAEWWRSWIPSPAVCCVRVGSRSVVRSALHYVKLHIVHCPPPTPPPPIHSLYRSWSLTLLNRPVCFLLAPYLPYAFTSTGTTTSNWTVLPLTGWGCNFSVVR